MMNLNESTIRSLANIDTFERGYQYFRDRSISNVVKRGQNISAKVNGSQYHPYEITIRLNESGNITQYVCTCPYDWGGACKHVVAVLLEFIHNSENVEEKTSLDQLLPQLSAAQLSDILLALTDGNFELTEKVERHLESLQAMASKSSAGKPSKAEAFIDVPRILRDIQDGFETSSQAGDDRFDGYYYDEYEELEINPEDGFDFPFSQVDRLLDEGALGEAETLIWLIADTFVEAYEQLDEWVLEYNEDSIFSAALDLDTKLAEVILSEELENNPDRQAVWESEIRKRKKTPLNFIVSKTALDHGWTYPPLVSAMAGNITTRGAWADENPPRFADHLSLARLRVLARQKRSAEYINLATAEGQSELAILMMARAGRTAEAPRRGRKLYLTHPTSLLEVVRVLFERGDQLEAFALAEHGLGLDSSWGMYELAQWLRDQTKGDAANRPLRLKAAQAAFEYSQTPLMDYQIAREIAGPEWSTTQPKLLKRIRRLQDLSGQIDIYLMEHMVEEAMRAIDKALYATEYDMHRVLEQTRLTHPNWGIGLCKRQAESIMDAGHSKNYKTAARWLETAREIYLMHGRGEAWESYVSQLLEKHRRKYSLVRC